MSLLKSTGKFLSKHAPLIFTMMGGAGVVTTAVLAARSHSDAQRYVEHNITGPDEKLDWMQYVKETWRFYIPPVLSGGTTIACIFAAQTMNSRRQAVLAAIIAAGQETLQEYRDATRTVVGEKKEREIYDEIAQRHADATPGTAIAILRNGDVLAKDTFTGQHFSSTVEKIRKAQNDIMEMVLFSEGYASFNDFARSAGIGQTAIGEEVGWNRDNPLEVIFSTQLTEDNIPLLVINYSRPPKFNPNGVW